MNQSEIYARLRGFCSAFEGVKEDYPWGHTAWKVGGKCFAIGDEQRPYVTVKSTLDKQAALIQLPYVEIASHVGRYGWVTVCMNEPDGLELALELVRESYEAVRPKRKAKDA